MTKLKELSVSDSFNAPGRGPSSPADVNWKMIAIYGGMALGTAIVFACTINYSLEQTSQRWQLQVKTMNEAHLSTISKKDDLIADLVRTVKSTSNLVAFKGEPTAQIDNIENKN